MLLADIMAISSHEGKEAIMHDEGLEVSINRDAPEPLPCQSLNRASFGIIEKQNVPQQASTRSKTVCGLSFRIFWGIVAGILTALIAAAVVGGIFGARYSNSRA